MDLIYANMNVTRSNIDLSRKFTDAESNSVIQGFITSRSFGVFGMGCEYI